jgi:two-component system, chemotaxis family, CheB/CheR fusion protein
LTDDPTSGNDAEKSEQNPAFRALLEHVHRTRNFDFSAYKPASLSRRIARRMQAVGVESYGAYQDYLEVHPDEFGLLFDTVLINVTDFFRDEEAWRYLASDVIPRILEAKSADSPVRVWSAGAASGQEAYSIAMLLAETMGKEEACRRIKIYGTDIDERALGDARQATYSEKEVASVPPVLLSKYFEHVQDRYVFNNDLRRCIIFGRHDLLRDAPISRIDLLACRNTLMYFNADAQSEVLSRFWFALAEHGFLFMGKAEMLLTRSGLFTPVHLQHRIFSKVVRPIARDRAGLTGGPSRRETTHEDDPQLRTRERMQGLAYEQDVNPQILFDERLAFASANRQARLLFNLDGGRVSPGLVLDDLPLARQMPTLRAAAERARNERRPVFLKDIESRRPLAAEGNTPRSESAWFDADVTPLIDPGGTMIAIKIALTDVTRTRQLQLELERLRQDVEAAYEAQQSTQEELETTNEELQSSNEELETTNEELQSANEELETMNEELQSTNDELEQVNRELQRRTEELSQSNAFLGAVLGGIDSGVIVVDRELRVTAWNPMSEELWGLRAPEVQGQHLMNLDIGLPIDKLRPALKACLGRANNGEPVRPDGAEPRTDGADDAAWTKRVTSGSERIGAGGSVRERVELEATNRRGRAMRMQATLTPLTNPAGSTLGVILLLNPLAAPPVSS